MAKQRQRSAEKVWKFERKRADKERWTKIEKVNETRTQQDSPGTFENMLST